MGISIWQLVIILLIVLLLFGAKRLRNVGSDLGSAVKGFKKPLAKKKERLRPRNWKSVKVKPSRVKQARSRQRTRPDS